MVTQLLGGRAAPVTVRRNISGQKARERLVSDVASGGIILAGNCHARGGGIVAQMWLMRYSIHMRIQ
jgi:hypothetical protein